jgi:hypothetical protein
MLAGTIVMSYPPLTGEGYWRGFLHGEVRGVPMCLLNEEPLSITGCVGV